MKTAQTNSLKLQTTKIFISSLFVAFIAFILLVGPAFAAAPRDGIVYEGRSVPGVKLGFTREKVTESYGEAQACDDDSSNRYQRTYMCSYAIEGANIDAATIYVTFERSAQIPAPNHDKVTSIRWSQEVTGWETAAGVNTKLALDKPEAVVEAYPNATVEFNSNGDIVQVRDASLGIQIDWQYTDNQIDQKPTSTVSMAIFFPQQFTLETVK